MPAINFALADALSAASVSAAASASALRASVAAASAACCAISSAVRGRSITSPVVQFISIVVSVSEIVFLLSYYEFDIPYKEKVDPVTKLPVSVIVNDVIAALLLLSKPSTAIK